MTCHDLFTLENLLIETSRNDMTRVHPGINIGLQYIRNTSEYILKLQLHQQVSIARDSSFSRGPIGREDHRNRG